MFKKKLIALGLCVAMLGSLVACGGENNSGTTDATPTPTTEASGDKTDDKGDANEVKNGADDHSSVSADCIVGFDDDKMAFATYNDADWSGDKDGEVSIVTKFDSKMLQVTRPNGNIPAVAIDVCSLLGDNAANCSKITLDVGVDNADGFAALSGSCMLYAGTANTLIETPWSIYLPAKSMITVTIDLGENVLDPAATNYLTFANFEDASTGTPSSILIDNIIFYDASGTPIAVNPDAEFAVNGVGEYDWSNGVKQPTDEVFLYSGVLTGTGWWPDNANSFSFVQNDTVTFIDPTVTPFGPGDVLTIYYSVADPSLIATQPYQSFPYLRMQNWNNIDADGNEYEYEGWPTNVICDVSWTADYLGKDGYEIDPSREFRYDNATQSDVNKDEDGTPGEGVMINDSYSIVQYPYEFIVECLEGAGIDPTDWTTVADFIGVADRGMAVRINAVTIGKAAE